MVRFLTTLAMYKGSGDDVAITGTTYVAGS